MELYFLDENYNVIDIIDGFSSIVWSEKFHEIGTFTLHFPREYVKRIVNSVYVRTPFSGEQAKCGRIECLSVNDDGDCTLSGHTLEVLLDDRIINGKGVYSGSLMDAVISAVSDNLRDCGVVIADIQPQITDEVSLSYGYNKLSDWLYTTLKPFGASFTVTLTPELPSPVFTLVKGVDRSSASDSGENAAVFSASFGNIVSFEYEKNTTDTKNTAYVEGADGTVITVDKSAGGKKRETYSLADDISPDSFDSVENYEAALRLRGFEVLSKCSAGMRVSAECDPDALPQYGKDYFLGDVCDVCDNDIGLSFSLRLTEADTVWENGKMTVFPSFGDEIRSIRNLYGNVLHI